jgi:hypothetical protein
MFGCRFAIAIALQLGAALASKLFIKKPSTRTAFGYSILYRVPVGYFS